MLPVLHASLRATLPLLLICNVKDNSYIANVNAMVILCHLSKRRAHLIYGEPVLLEK